MSFMSKQTISLTNQEWRILFLLMKHKGRSSFDHMMTESGLCLGHFMNHANELLKKGLITQGETFKDYVITPKGRRMVKGAALVIP